MMGARYQSCPSRGTWIEIRRRCPMRSAALGRAPRGARGLKYVVAPPSVGAVPCRAPRGARGLKLSKSLPGPGDPRSCPSRGTWIEIHAGQDRKPAGRVVPLAGHVD